MKEPSMRISYLSLCWGLTVLSGCTDAGSGLPQGVTQEPIIGGQADSTSHAVVGIITREGELCSGSLILPNLVLTARHCVASLPSENVQCGVSMFGAVHAANDFAVSWDDNLRDNIDNSTVYDVKAVRVPTDPGVCGNDIALLELSTNVPATQATPIEPRLDTPPTTNEVFDAVGYGLTNPNDQAGTTAGKRMRFNGAHVSCVGSACRNLGAVANEWAGQSPVCSGDSGGPALDSDGRVIGATSRGPADCMSAVYSGVSSWKSFILDGANTAVTDGGYTPPGWVSGMGDSDAGSPLDGGTPGTDGGIRDGGVGMSDGGMPSDGGVGMPDGGIRDGGVGMPDGGIRDGGVGTPDGGSGMSDAGSPNDAGVRMPDGGMPSDAGTPAPDAGTPGDAGTTPSDAGTHAPDAGSTPPDGANKLSDAGVGSSAGAPGKTPPPTTPPIDSGCGCRTVSRSTPAGFGGFAAFLLAALAVTRHGTGRRRAV
jgi:MYXO-CTERM domain-containing protein